MSDLLLVYILLNLLVQNIRPTGISNVRPINIPNVKPTSKQDTVSETYQYSAQNIPVYSQIQCMEFQTYQYAKCQTYRIVQDVKSTTKYQYIGQYRMSNLLVYRMSDSVRPTIMQNVRAIGFTMQNVRLSMPNVIGQKMSNQLMCRMADQLVYRMLDLLVYRMPDIPSQATSSLDSTIHQVQTLLGGSYCRR